MKLSNKINIVLFIIIFIELLYLVYLNKDIELIKHRFTTNNVFSSVIYLNIITILCIISLLFLLFSIYYFTVFVNANIYLYLLACVLTLTILCEYKHQEVKNKYTNTITMNDAIKLAKTGDFILCNEFISSNLVEWIFYCCINSLSFRTYHLHIGMVF